MQFGIEHLYHDSVTNNAYTALDAKEKLRTRQINAREGKQLKRFNQTLDRAYTVLTKRQDWEKNHIQQDLHIIQLKSPSLEKSLKRESDAENNQNRRLPIITTSSNSLIKSRSSGKSSNSSGSSTHRTTSVRRHNGGKITSMDLRYSAESVPVVEARTAPETLTVYMKKADVVARNLHRLYKRKRERTSYIRQAVEIIRANNLELLNEARVYILDKSLSDKDNEGKHYKESDVEDIDSVHKEDVKEEVGESHEEGVHFATSKENEDEHRLTLIEPDENNNNKQNVNKTKDLIKILPSIERVSSVIVNPSDSSSVFDEKHAKWTDIFRIPEMWKLFDNRKKVKQVTKPAPPSLVTIRGKLRKTLLR